MAVYKITSLNYMTAGSNRAFVNVDTVLNYELYHPVVLLRNEEQYIDPTIVSAYWEFSGVSEDWSRISVFLSSLGDLDRIGRDWSSLSDSVSAMVLSGISETPLSTLFSDIVTEQRDGKWFKTEYLSREFKVGNGNTHEKNAMAASPWSKDVILNEQQRYYGELSDGHHMYVRLYPPGSDHATIQRIYDFNKKHQRYNRTFVLDTDLASRAFAPDFDGMDSSQNIMKTGSEEIVYPMYDMIDVHVKSAYQNQASSLKTYDAVNVDRKREDVYLPQLQKDPIGFCQLQNDAYMLTEATSREQGMLESSLKTSRMNKDVGRTYTVQIKSGNAKTYLYSRRSDGVIDVQGMPQSNLAGIEYNNITQFPQSEIRVGYSQGNEYGYTIRGKNALDSQYDMNVKLEDNRLSAFKCRDYAGIGQFSGNQLYFKFYDGVEYNGISAGSNIQVNRTDSADIFSVVPYQKIECALINKYTSANTHKTRFFSVKMLNTELGQYENVDTQSSKEDLQKKLYGQIMQDIRGAVREIVENLQPAHTQLYRVMFDG